MRVAFFVLQLVFIVSGSFSLIHILLHSKPLPLDLKFDESIWFISVLVFALSILFLLSNKFPKMPLSAFIECEPFCRFSRLNTLRYAVFFMVSIEAFFVIVGIINILAFTFDRLIFLFDLNQDVMGFLYKFISAFSLLGVPLVAFMKGIICKKAFGAEKPKSEQEDVRS